MAGKHEHKHDHCEHQHIAYCKQCGVVHCKDCGREWQDNPPTAIVWPTKTEPLTGPWTNPYPYQPTWIGPSDTPTWSQPSKIICGTTSSVVAIGKDGAVSSTPTCTHLQ